MYYVKGSFDCQIRNGWLLDRQGEQQPKVLSLPLIVIHLDKNKLVDIIVLDS